MRPTGSTDTLPVIGPARRRNGWTTCDLSPSVLVGRDQQATGNRVEDEVERDRRRSGVLVDSVERRDVEGVHGKEVAMRYVARRRRRAEVSALTHVVAQLERT